MKLLLDTHSWLWLQADRTRWGAHLDAALDPANDLFLSAASSWEICIKWVLGKLPLPVPPKEYVPSRMRLSGVGGLPVEHSHALRVAELPLHHRDPFDRILIAQALAEGMTIVTSDDAFRNYDVPLVWLE